MLSALYCKLEYTMCKPVHMYQYVQIYWKRLWEILFIMKLRLIDDDFVCVYVLRDQHQLTKLDLKIRI